MTQTGFQRFISVILLIFSVATAASTQEPFTDEAMFRLYKNESQIGTIRYSYDADGNYEREFLLSLGGQEVRYGFTIQSEDGRWRRSVICTPTDTIEIQEEGGAALFSASGQSFRVPITEPYVLYDSYGPVFESLLIRRYDQIAGGTQTFRRFLFPSRMADVTLAYQGQEIRTLDSSEVVLQRYELNLIGIRIRIWAGMDDRIVMMHVPEQYAIYLREGYEPLLSVVSEDPSLSRPEHEVVRSTVWIPMRDGVRLSTDLYRPKGIDENLPVVLIRTPYKKEMQELEGDYYARRGYAVAIQDCRGRFASEGTWVAFMHEAEDGYDTIEWLGVQPWSNGRVGMVGGSYVGWVQLWAATQNPPHLTTVIPSVTPPDPFYNIPYEYGSFFILGSIWLTDVFESEATGDLSGKVMAVINARRYEKILKTLPVIDLDLKVFGKECANWREWIKHNVNNGYWESANFMKDLEKVTIPVFLQSGWFDGDGIGTKLNFQFLKNSQSPFVKMIIGPWGHTSQSYSRIGDHDFGPEASMDLQTRFLKWFDRFLKGIDNDILEEPRVQLFVMESNRWLKSSTYPLPETRFVRYYLGSKRGANTSRGDGFLALESGKSKPYDTYVYDPGDPTPYPEYYFKSDEELKKDKTSDLDVDAQKTETERFHQHVTDARKDILVYQTPPLEEPVTIAGPVSAVLYASTTAKDTDWFVTLMDADPDDRFFVLARGTLRARFRNSTSAPAPVTPDSVIAYDLDLWHTGITFQKGHRIRIEVASSLFPVFSRNLNTGGHNEMETRYVKARQRIYLTPEFPSHILLPLISDR